MKAYFVILLLLLAACAEPAIRTTPFNGTTQSDIPVTPLNASETRPASCTGKTCEGKCIAATACCTLAECGDGACVNNKCVPKPVCAFNEEFRAEECLCAEGYSRCKEQGKCIKTTSCCHTGNCNRGNRCTPTVWRASVCFQVAEKRICRLLADNNRTELVQINDADYRLGVLSWSNNGNITLLVNNQTFQLGENQSRPLAAEHTIFQEGVDEI